MPPRLAKRARVSGSEPAIVAPDPHEDKHVVFTAWSKHRGVEIKNVKPAKIPGRGLGLVTTAKIKVGARILFVPEKAMFKPDGSVPHASPQAQLAASAMKACTAADSNMGIWKETWPVDSDFQHSLPMRWPHKLREHFPVSVMQPLLRQEEDYTKDVGALQDFLAAGNHSAEEFRYYWSIVNSRSFHFKAKGKVGTMVMCPFIDYINHGPSGTTCDVFQRPNGYEVIADRDYVAGEEILANYGAHNNDKLLVHYGFMIASVANEWSDEEDAGPNDTPNGDDDVRLDHIVLPLLTPTVRAQLQDVGFLGGYALLPATNELCFKTQVAVRAMLLTCNEWEYFVENGEDLAEDQSWAVTRFLLHPFKQWADHACGEHRMIDEKLDREEYSSMKNELEMLRMRWLQIITALSCYMDMKPGSTT
ncbi:hypothetical protein LTR27_007122 [Elasticomyces elasticus]|nr:hypothetical protein LTR27_007122 [Elasticomyces elasticus]